MSKEEYSTVIIKSEPCNDDVHYINDKIKVEKDIAEAKPKVDLVYIKEEPFMKVKQEEITIKDETPSSFDLTGDDVVMFSTKTEVPSTSFSTEAIISIVENWFACNFCQYKTSRKSDLKLHKHHHMRKKPKNNRKFQCTECEYETPKKSHLIQHMVIHTGEKPFACNLCEFKTARKDYLNRHMMKHTGEKPFACNFCDFKTAKNSDLTIHHRIHTGDKPFACNFCSFKAVTNIKLTIHKRIHTGEKPFACNLCRYKTAQKSNLKIHMMNHTGEKPFACNFCDFKSVTNAKLIIHKRIHTGEKPFACYLCEYKAIAKGKLTIHMRKHTNEKPLVCNASKKSLKFHNIRTHTDGKQRDNNLYEFKEGIKDDKSLMKVKQEEITIKSEIPCNSNAQDDLIDDNV